VFAADVCAEIGCVAGSDSFAEGYLGIELHFDLFTKPERFFPVLSCNCHMLVDIVYIDNNRYFYLFIMIKIGIGCE